MGAALKPLLLDVDGPLNPYAVRPHLLHRVDPAIGLTTDDAARIRHWAAGL